MTQLYADYGHRGVEVGKRRREMGGTSRFRCHRRICLPIAAGGNSTRYWDGVAHRENKKSPTSLNTKPDHLFRPGGPLRQTSCELQTLQNIAGRRWKGNRMWTPADPSRRGPFSGSQIKKINMAAECRSPFCLVIRKHYRALGAV